MLKKRLGDLLTDAGLLTKADMEYALQVQKKKGKKLGEILIEEDLVSEKQIIEVLEFQLGIPHMDITKYYIDPEITKLVSEKLARRHELIPIKIDRSKLIVAMTDPLNIYAIDDVKIETGMEIEPAISTKQDVLNAIEQYYEKQSAEKALEEFKEQYNMESIENIDEEILNVINNAPVVKLVNSIIKQAIKYRASDVHIEPFEKHLRVRFRVDGDLQEIMTPAKSTHSAIVTRIKIMGKMDIAEKRLPQDGRIETVIDGEEIDLRISTLPTVYGEKIVIRILDRRSFLKSKNQIGFTEENLNLFNSIVKNPNGIILVTGPTGSGKSTTLYSIVKELNKINKNIITVEDPVEYQVDGVTQVQVNSKAGLTFASGLRSILRQDPDIIMIGEIRDVETAQIAVRAAITGHLVLSTMHTNDTASTISRLLDMGIDSYLVSSSIVGVVAQRLVKKLCNQCKVKYTPDEKEKTILSISKDTYIYRREGCGACNNTGYKGRTAVHEIVSINKDIRGIIDRGGSIDEIRDSAARKGMTTLKGSCSQLVLEGITSMEELIKVAYSTD
ncbi:type II secretion system protein GspE [Alkaliphilus pronyensis]|uniref:Type II secretion system protein GspE n=1 Tax=Alkaliphilus pronyensis TaxID=1482732 RepID=A0A6I0FG47_9FIRM|nr:GspE/PulE family protein [Alkaliphilus pronyensis]KAB3537358.1 type II secretion system protein GspE [Alkaliphilus pronyensis]